MKILKILSLLLIAGLMFSCEEEIEDSVKMQDVEFGITDVNPLLKSGWDWKCSEDEPVSALIKIDGTWYNPYVFYLNGNLYTQTVKLPVKIGYQLEEFLLLNVKLTPADIAAYPLLPAGAKILKAAPLQLSEYASYVQNPLVVPFNVGEFTKTEMNVDVLCYQPGDHEMFGFKWFNVAEFVVREICFFGDLCLKNPKDYQNTDYGRVFNLDNYPFDLPAIFRIKAYKGTETTPYATFTNIHLVNGKLTFTGPVCAKFPDPVKADQSIQIKFVMEVLVKVGNTGQYVEYKTWNFDSKNPIVPIVPTNQQVVDFVIGNCYSPDTPPMYVFPPYQNLPKKASVDLSSLVTSSGYPITGGYWGVKTVAFLPAGVPQSGYEFPEIGQTAIGWCGDVQKTITAGVKTFDIYSSLKGGTWVGLRPHMTLENFQKVNWLFNNLHKLTDTDNKNYGYPKLTGLVVESIAMPGTTDEEKREAAKDLQHAIWLTLGQNSWPSNVVGGGTPSARAQRMAELAIANGSSFVPLPGTYAGVLLVFNNAESQLVFIIVDP